MNNDRDQKPPQHSFTAGLRPGSARHDHAKDPRDFEMVERVSSILESCDIKATRQRVDVASVLLAQHIHMSADEVFGRVEALGSTVSRATVYNTLSLMVERGILSQVIVDPTRVFYDSNTVAHHHVFDIDTGKLTDVAPDDIEINRLPTLPEGKSLEGVDVIIRVKSSSDTVSQG